MPNTLYTTVSSELTSVADAIRSKGGTTESLTYPAGFVTAINNIPSGSGSAPMKPIVMRSDAELVKTYTYDKYIHEDEEITIPAYTTTAKVLKASASLTPTYAMDMANYNYYIVERMLTIPEYSITSLAKGRVEYVFSATGYEVSALEANTIHALIEPTRKVTSRSAAILNTGNYARIVYYSSGTAIAAYASAAYGTYQTATAPAISSTTLTLKSPALGIRGHTTYFTSTYMNALTDIRYQYRIEVWRAPKDNLSFDGWAAATNAEQILSCIDTTNHNLT